MQDEILDFDSYKPHYKPLRIGTMGRKTKLEGILDKIQLSFEDYIWYTDVTKVDLHSLDICSSLSSKTKKSLTL